MKVTIDLNTLKSENDTYSETTAKSIEHLTGKSFSDVLKNGKEEPNIPEGKPSQWQRDVKLKFIDTYGRDEFKRLVNERR